MTETLRIPPRYSPTVLTSTGDLHKPNRNHLLYEFRGNFHSDAHHETVEWLFQLTRHWWLWQHDAMGTPYLDVHDPGGPVPKEWSDESGEDSVFYTIEQIIDDLPDTEHRIRTILHTYAVLNRLLNLIESNEQEPS